MSKRELDIARRLAISLARLVESLADRSGSPIPEVTPEHTMRLLEEARDTLDLRSDFESIGSDFNNYIEYDNFFQSNNRTPGVQGE